MTAKNNNSIATTNSLEVLKEFKFYNVPYFELINFYNGLICFNVEHKKYHFYNLDKEESEFIFPNFIFVSTPINKHKLALISANCIYIFNYFTKEVESIYSPIQFCLVYDVICFEEKILVITARDYIFIYEIYTSNINKLRYAEDNELIAKSRRIVPVNDEIVIVIMGTLRRYNFFYLVNWKTKQIINTIMTNVIFINRITAKIEAKFIKNKPISRLYSRCEGVNKGEIFTFDEKFYEYMDKKNVKFYFTIVKNRIIGYIERVEQNNIINIMDLNNYQILQQIEFQTKLPVADIFHNDKYFIFKTFGNHIGFELNLLNLEQYFNQFKSSQIL